MCFQASILYYLRPQYFFTATSSKTQTLPSPLSLLRTCALTSLSFMVTPIHLVPGRAILGLELIQSCNGLFLCRDIDETSTCRTFSVVNPTTNKFSILMIPTVSPAKTLIGGCALAFDPYKSTHYKVICFETLIRSLTCLIQIYSSETRTWRLLGSTFYDQGRSNGVYCNGAIHWIFGPGELLYFHVDEERFGSVDSPYPPSRYDELSDTVCRYFESSAGHLNLIDVFKSSPTKFEVLELRRDYSGWFVKYHVDIDPPTSLVRYFQSGSVNVLLLTRDANEEEGCSSLLLQFPDGVYSFNLNTKSFRFFHELTDPSLHVRRYKYPYMDTLACV